MFLQMKKKKEKKEKKERKKETVKVSYWTAPPSFAFSLVRPGAACAALAPLVAASEPNKTDCITE